MAKGRRRRRSLGSAMDPGQRIHDIAASARRIEFSKFDPNAPAAVDARAKMAVQCQKFVQVWKKKDAKASQAKRAATRKECPNGRVKKTIGKHKAGTCLKHPRKRR